MNLEVKTSSPSSAETCIVFIVMYFFSILNTANLPNFQVKIYKYNANINQSVRFFKTCFRNFSYGSLIIFSRSTSFSKVSSMKYFSTNLRKVYPSQSSILTPLVCAPLACSLAFSVKSDVVMKIALVAPKYGILPKRLRTSKSPTWCFFFHFFTSEMHWT